VRKQFEMIVFSIFFTIVFVFSSPLSLQASQQTIDLQLRVITRVLTLIDSLALTPTDLEKCRNVMLKALSGQTLSPCLDEFSGYLTKEEAKKVDQELTGVFTGIGVIIAENESGQVYVVRPLFGGPAEMAGIQPGDILLRARNKGETEATLIKNQSDAAEMLRGLAGTDVFLTIERGGMRFIIRVTRAEVLIESVSHRPLSELSGIVGYIRIGVWSQRTPHELEASLKQLKNNDNFMHSVIIDLRNNPGGLLTSVIDSLYLFNGDLNAHLLSVRYRNGSDSYTIRYPYGLCPSDPTEPDESCRDVRDPNTGIIKTPGEFQDTHIVILMNEQSASASEIFACTMQGWSNGNHKFIIVGEQSFGKGVGQTHFSLPDGSRLQLTTFEYECGNPPVSIHGSGVTPDHVVPDIRGRSPQSDPMIQKALELLRKPKTD